MTCHTVQKSLSAFLDSALSRGETESLSQHLAECRDCAACSQELMELRSLLRNLPVSPMPRRLAGQLRVLASHEKRRNSATRWQRSMAWLQLAVDNLMRPVAIPFAGGIVAAIFAFSLITPTLTIRAADASTDLPFYWLNTKGAMSFTPPFGFQGDETEVVLTIDANGQITDYRAASGKVTRELIDNIGNSLLFSSFDPPRSGGVPVSGIVRVKFQKNGNFIVVKG